MGLAAAIVCAASLLHLPVPATVVSVAWAQPGEALCAAAGHPGCDAVAGGTAGFMAVVLAPGAGWALQVHEGCHVAQRGNGLASRGPGAERQCEWVQSRAEQCR